MFSSTIPRFLSAGLIVISLLACFSLCMVCLSAVVRLFLVVVVVSRCRLSLMLFFVSSM